MFRRLDYQDRALGVLDTYIDALKERKAKADRVAALASENPDLSLSVPDFAGEAWGAMQEAGKLPPSRAGIS